MADQVINAAEPRIRLRSQVLRAAGLVLVLLAELCWLSVRFDAAPFGSAETWTGWVLAHASMIPQVGIAVVTALFVLAGPRLQTIGSDFLRQTRHRSLWWIWMAPQLAAFCGFVAVSYFVFEGGYRDSDYQKWWLALWGTAAAACLTFWLATLAPARFWRQLVHENLVLLAIVFGVGGLALIAGWLTQSLWEPLGDATFVLVERILRLVYPQIVSLPAERIIGTADFQVSISSQCSGYEGIGLICAFLGAFFWTFRSQLRFPQAWLLWPIGIICIWLLNAVRIAALVAIGTSYSPEVAAGGFHSQAGWLLFNGVSLGLMYVALRLPYWTNQERSSSAVPTDFPVSAYLAPLFCLVAMNMLGASFSEGLERLYPLKVLATATVLWQCRRAFRATQWNWSWHAVLNGALVFALWMITAPRGDLSATAAPKGFADLAPIWAAIWITFRVVGGVITVPLAEELAFRGYLLRRFVAGDFETVSYRQAQWWGVLLSSALFGLLHERWLAGTMAGLCYALAARRRENLGDAVLAHATTNALLAAVVLTNGAWNLW